MMLKRLSKIVYIVGLFLFNTHLISAVQSAVHSSPSPSWTKVQDLRPGDLLYTKAGWQEIAEIEYVKEQVTVYNLSVSSPNTYFSNGILAHNKDVCPINHTVWGLPYGQTAYIECHSRNGQYHASLNIWQDKVNASCGINDDKRGASYFDDYSPSDIGCTLHTSGGVNLSQDCWGGECPFACEDDVVWNIPCGSPSPSPSISPSPSASASPSPPPITPPDPPTNLSASDECSSEVTFSWDFSGDWGSDPDGNPSNNYFYVYVSKLSDPNDVLVCEDVPILESGSPNCIADLENYFSGAEGSYTWYVIASSSGDDFDPDTYSQSADDSFTRLNEPPDVVNTAGSAIWPEDGQDIYTNDVSLSWYGINNWGCNLDEGTRIYEYTIQFDKNQGMGTAKTVCNLSDSSGPPSQCPNSEECNCSSADTRDLIWGTTYYWQITTNNGFATAETPIVSFTPIPGPWWQVVGGSIYAAINIDSNIPVSSCKGLCDPYLMLNLLPSSDHGTAIYGDSIDLGEGTIPDNIAEDDNDWYANSTYNGEIYNYDWWVNHLRNENKQPPDDGSTFDVSGKEGIYELTNSGTVNISGAVTDIVVLLHYGDININGNITVPEGSFLMVVASGTISIDSALGGSDISPAVEGIYIADVIDTGGGNVHLYAAGSFIGWEDVVLGRSIDDSSDEPSMTFTFRPDFIINSPDYVKVIEYPVWQRVPG